MYVVCRYPYWKLRDPARINADYSLDDQDFFDRYTSDPRRFGYIFGAGEGEDPEINSQYHTFNAYYLLEW